MSFVVRPYSDDDYDSVSMLHDAVFPTYRTQPDSWHPATQFDYQRSGPHRYVALEATMGQISGYGAIRLLRERNARIDLMTHPTWQQHGIASRLLEHLIVDAHEMDAIAVHVRARLDYPQSVSFLANRDFTETHRMHGLRLSVMETNLAPFWPLVRHVEANSIAITTFAAERQDPTCLHKLHSLQNAVLPDWPDPERVSFSPISFSDFVERLQQETRAAPDALFIAKHNSTYIGYCGMFALGTAVRPEYRNQGIATALKVMSIAYAQQHKRVTAFTCTANPAMLAINEKLGYRRELVELRMGKPISSLPR